jgi:diguanylate cyclase
MIDIDSFKQINDRYGHIAGDFVLKKVAFDMQSQLREPDVLGRYGGDEFVIGLPETSRESAQIVANSILTEVAKNEYAFAPFPPFHVTLSVGVKCLENETKLDELIDAADVKLYQAKKQGKNVVKG